MKTIFHQVQFPDILDIKTDNYYYCANETCVVGYFSQQGNRISKKQLRVFSEVKDNKLCYCFDIDSKQYLDSLKNGTAVSIKNFVIQKTKNNDCACEIRNPSGKCCLANFNQLEKAFDIDK